MKHLLSNTPSTLSAGKHNEYQVMSEHKRNAYVFYKNGGEVFWVWMDGTTTARLMAHWANHTQS